MHSSTGLAQYKTAASSEGMLQCHHTTAQSLQAADCHRALALATVEHDCALLKLATLLRQLLQMMQRLKQVTLQHACGQLHSAAWTCL
jgi:hypothetical protein